MRVLHLIASPTLTGPADPALGLARGLRSLGVDVLVACDGKRLGNMVDKVREANVPRVEGLELSTRSTPLAWLGDRTRLLALRREVDLVHVHTSHDHAIAFAAGCRPLVRSAHHPRSIERRALLGVAYSRTDAFFVPARAYRERLLASYRFVPPERAVVLPGAIDLGRFSPGADGESVRASMGVPSDAFVVGMVARIKPGRGHEELLAAFARIASDPRAHLAFIGKGEGVPELERRIASSGFRDRIHLYGFRDADLPGAIASCDVTVLLREGNDAGCRAVLESMAVAVPVIGAQMPAVEEALGGGAGLLVPPGDVHALAGALERVMSLDPEARRALGQRGCARILERHTDDHRARRALALYEAVLGGAPS